MVVESGKRRGRGRPKEPIPRSTFLRAAQGIFADAGFQGASMSAIAREAGVSKATLFHHFETKEDLYIEVLTAIASDLGRLVHEAVEDRGNFHERLDRLAEAIIRYLGGTPRAARLLLREFVDAGPFMNSAAALSVATVLDDVVALYQDGQDAGLVVPQDLRHLAATSVALHLHWFAATPVTRHLLGGSPFTPEAIEDRIREVKAQARRLCTL
ncbi:MAG: helix-turn-helix transcriptional regulator [Deltaproteobacteria bacterium]|nr:helix-turn-helix transcriptional regulator [Deltaproteobacteria bacterium]